MEDGSETATFASRAGRLAFLFMAHASGTANIALVLAMAPAVERALALSHAQFGMIVSSYYAALLAAALPAGLLVDRIGIRMALAAAHALFAGGMLLFALSGGTLAAAAGLATCGVGYSLINPATARGVMVWFPPRGRATAMGAKQTGVPAGGMLGAIVAVSQMDWHVLAIGFAAVMAAGAIGCAIAGADNPPVETPTRLGEIPKLLRLPGVNAYNAGACLYATAQGAFFSYVVLFARDAFGAAPAVTSLCLGIAYVASAAGRIGWGIVSDLLARNGRIVSLVTCGVASAFGTALLVLAPSAGGLILLLPTAALLGLTLGGYAGLTQTAAAELVEPRLVGAAIGYNMLLTNLGTMLGPALFGAGIETIGYAPSWMLVAVAVLTGAALFHIGSARHRAAVRRQTG